MVSRAQMLDGYRLLKAKGVTLGMHTMVPNELNPDYFVETARILRTSRRDPRDRRHDFEFINLAAASASPTAPSRSPSTSSASAPASGVNANASSSPPACPCPGSSWSAAA